MPESGRLQWYTGIEPRPFHTFYSYSWNASYSIIVDNIDPHSPSDADKSIIRRQEGSDTYEAHTARDPAGDFLFLPIEVNNGNSVD